MKSQQRKLFKWEREVSRTLEREVSLWKRSVRAGETSVKESREVLKGRKRCQ